MEPVARDARPDDAAELVRLRELMYRSMGVDTGQHWQEACRRHLAANVGGAQLLGAVLDAPSGTGLAASALAEVQQRMPSPRNPTGRHAHVLSVSTDPRWRRMGMARAAMRHLLDGIEAAGVTAAELHATPTGEPLYRALGFTERGGGLEMHLLL